MAHAFDSIMMRGISAILLFSAVAACGPTKGAPNTGDDGDDAGNPPADAEIYFDSPIDSSCGAQTENIGVMNLGDPPDLLVVLDRSGSMTAPPPAFPPIFDSKWTIMKNALVQITTQKDMQIKFGMLEFPSDENCAANAAPEVGIALGTHTMFASYFTARAPGGNTPAHVALQSALQYYNTLTPNPAGRYVIFATDGVPNCLGGDPDAASDAATVAAVTALKNAGIFTYVLGFGTFGLPAGTLNDAAVAGGKPKPGATKFYEANNANDLAMALQAIAGGIVVPSCSYALQSAPPDPNSVTVTINGMVVPRSPSHTNGWDYHPNAMTITFFGTYCQQIQMGAMTNVSFVYGCPGPVIQ
jgi:von Willebrand factor type A domain